MAMLQQRFACTAALLALMFTHATAIDDGEAAKELSTRHSTLVLPMLNEEHLDNTDLATNLLAKLATKSQAVTQAKQNTDSPDTTLDECRVLENTTLHTWIECNKTRQDMTGTKQKECKAQEDASPGSYTIDQSKNFDISYKKVPKPGAICNFATYKIEGTDASCDAFVEDILEAGKDEFTADYEIYTEAEKKCEDSKSALDAKVKDCLAAEEAYTAQEAQCTIDETTLKVKLCKFEGALKSKCKLLKQFNAALGSLLSEEENINKEIRAVSYSKCLLDSYATQTCFKTSVQENCTSMVNGAAEKYATAAAEEINKFREDSKAHLLEYACEATSFTIGTNDLSYEKQDATNQYSYYTKKEITTLSASADGVLTPSPCLF